MGSCFSFFCRIFSGVFSFLGAIPRVPNFAEIYARGSRGLLQAAPWDLIPPGGTRQARGGRARAHPGAGRSDPCGGGHTPGRQGPGRLGRRPSGGHTERGAAAHGANGAKSDGPRGRARRRLFRRGRAGRVHGGRRRGDAARAAAKAARFAPGCVGLSLRQPRRGAAAGKSRVFAYKEAGFSPAFLCRIRAVFARKPCAFHRVAISAAQSDECVAGRERRGSPPRGRRRGREKPPGTREEAP